MQKKYLNVDEAAAFTGLSRSTLNKRRCYGEGPPFHKLGRRRVVYALSDLEEWIANCRRQSTTDMPAKDK